MRDSGIFYKSFRDAIRQNLSPEDQLKAYDAIFDYMFEDKEPEEFGAATAVWMMAKPQIDANNRRLENGKKGGRPKTEPKPNNNQEETKSEPNESKSKPNVNVNVNVNDNVNDKKRFTPPALDEVKEYCRERKNNVDPERFIDFYASKGWKVGNQPMKDWKACVRTWEKRDRASPEKKNDKIHFELEREYDFDELEQKLLKKRRAVNE